MSDEILQFRGHVLLLLQSRESYDYLNYLNDLTTVILRFGMFLKKITITITIIFSQKKKIRSKRTMNYDYDYDS